MNLSKRFSACLALLAATLALSPIASADTITATLTSMALPNYATGDVYAYGSNVGDAAVGGILWQGDPGNSDPALQGAFVTYCIDITHDINFGGSYQFTEESLGDALSDSSAQNNPNAVTQITDLFAADFPGAAVTGVPDDTTTEAAFQLAIWNIIYNSPTSPTAVPQNGTATASIFAIDGGFSDPAAVALANTWLANLGPSSNTPLLTGLAAYQGSQGQVYIGGFAPNANPNDSPVPATSVVYGVLGLVGACTLWNASRRRTTVVTL